MRIAFWAVCLTSTALWSAAALAQLQPQATQEAPIGKIEGRAAISQCDQLESYLQQARPANPGVTLEQVEQWRTNADAGSCEENLKRLLAGTSGPVEITPLPTPKSGSPLNAYAGSDPSPTGSTQPPAAPPSEPAPRP